MLFLRLKRMRVRNFDSKVINIWVLSFNRKHSLRMLMIRYKVIYIQHSCYPDKWRYHLIHPQTSQVDPDDLRCLGCILNQLDSTLPTHIQNRKNQMHSSKLIDITIMNQLTQPIRDNVTKQKNGNVCKKNSRI